MLSSLLTLTFFIAQAMTFGPLIAMAFYLLHYHGYEEQNENDWQ